MGASLALLGAVEVADARGARLRQQARLRQGPSASSELLAMLPEGSRVDVLEDSNGWRRVTTPDGKTGYVWNEHLIEGEVAAAPSETPRPEVAPTPSRPEVVGILSRPEAVPIPPRSIAEEVRALREQVEALRQRPEPATGAELDAVRAQIERLADAHRDLARRIDDRMIPPTGAPDPAAGGTATVGPVLILFGAVAGFLASRIAQRRRESRQRSRLRI